MSGLVYNDKKLDQEARMKKILVLHGPNLNLLGSRETDIYGAVSLEHINAELKKQAQELGLDLRVFQSNHEGELVSAIQQAMGEADILIINPAAYTHTSVAIRDAIAAAKIPTIEVHLSNIYKREEFRHHSMVAPVAHGQISGFGPTSYFLALQAAADILKRS
jgi:3-dehydroquinate dehydratase-2